MSTTETHRKLFRVSSFLAVTGLAMAFVLAFWREQPAAFVTVAPIVIGGKWIENSVERWNETK